MNTEGMNNTNKKVARSKLQATFLFGGDGEIRTLELVSELHDFQSCALDRTRRHLQIVLEHYNGYLKKNQVLF